MDSSLAFTEIRMEREKAFSMEAPNIFSLNSVHDRIMEKTVAAAIASFEKRAGPPPSSYCFFVMGSAGRREQGIWSDQDHGIVHSGVNETDGRYFLNLGEAIAEGFMATGYKKCEGNVMAGNPLWCKRLEDWQSQIDSWIDEASWETIRHLLTFIDGRGIYGENSQLAELKSSAYQAIRTEKLLPRMAQNTKHVKKSIGILGQLLLETHGPFTGMLNIKDTGLFPYVNAARLLAIHGNIYETETIERMKRISDDILTKSKREQYIQGFIALQEFRMAFSKHDDYESGHYIQTGILSKEDKKQLKEAMKLGTALFETAAKLLEEDESPWA